MGCNCKNSNEKNYVDIQESDVKIENNKKPAYAFIFYTVKVVGFLISLLFLPVILGAAIWFMFKTIVLNKDLDITSLLKKIGEKKEKNIEEKENDDEEEIYDEEYDELVAMNVEDITDKKY